ncbi:MAG: hypothetical protein IJ736_04615 [Firmicutes bacterium]|nr:hypothetical protein [Bacillota bacterium]
MKIEIYPLIGIKMNEIKLVLGMSLNEIITALGEPAKIFENMPYAPDITQIYYYESELRFDFNKESKLEFIEFLGGIDGRLHPEIYGVDAFSIHADELVDILTQKNGEEAIDNENGYSYAFPNIGVGIYRESTPDDIEEMVKNTAEEREMFSEKDYNYELSKAIHWATIGLGDRTYYAKF